MAETTWRVLDLLLADELGSPVAVADALDTLQAASLVGRTGALVFVTGLRDSPERGRRP